MKEIVFRLPDYEVLLRIRVNPFSSHLEEQIAWLTETFEIEEYSEVEDLKEYHFEFKTWEEAVAAGETLKHLSDNPNLLVLKVKANYNRELKPIIHKGQRRHGKTLSDTVKR